MHSHLALLVLLVLASTSLAAPAANTTRVPDPDFPLPSPYPYGYKSPNINYDLIAALKASPNHVTQTALLNDSDFMFDFMNPPSGASELKGRGGTLVNAFSIDFPALVGNNMAMAVGFTKPCGFNTPHTHPRATELSIVVNGSMISEFVGETGARKIRNVHNTYSVVLFPQGSLHLEFNPNCEPMTFVAAFNSEDPGINTPAESLFELDDDLVGLATGLEFLDGADIDLYRNLVPSSLAQGVESCLEKCGIPKTDYV